MRNFFLMLTEKVEVSHRMVNSSCLPVKAKGLDEKVTQVPEQVKSGVTTYSETKQSNNSLKSFIIQLVAEHRFGILMEQDFIMLVARVDL